MKKKNPNLNFLIVYQITYLMIRINVKVKNLTLVQFNRRKVFRRNAILHNLLN